MSDRSWSYSYQIHLKTTSGCSRHSLQNKTRQLIGNCEVDHSFCVNVLITSKLRLHYRSYQNGRPCSVSQHRHWRPGFHTILSLCYISHLSACFFTNYLYTLYRVWNKEMNFIYQLNQPINISNWSITINNNGFNVRNTPRITSGQTTDDIHRTRVAMGHVRECVWIRWLHRGNIKRLRWSLDNKWV